MGKIYGYARISKPQQNIERQIRNIKKEYPDAIIYQEAYTGTTLNRPRFEKLLEKVGKGDTIIFDSVSRMSRDAEEGTRLYFQLFEKGVTLIFLKEPYINTEVYENSLGDKIKLTGTNVDEIFKGLNNYFRALAAEQIRLAFEQAEKEVKDLHQRTKEGMETARQNEKQIGQKKGTRLCVKKKEPIKAIIRKHAKCFGGELSDVEVMSLISAHGGIAGNTYYKYKRELLLEEQMRKEGQKA